MIQLRDYQTAIVERDRELMLKGVHRILNQAPTGAGKTALTVHMFGTAAAKGMRSWFIVHRRELVKQSVDAFDRAGIKFGIVAAGFQRSPKQLIQICSIQTLARCYKELLRPKLIAWDECHHLAAKSWEVIFKALPDAFHVGLTATPERLDGTGLGKFFDELVLGPSVAELIEEGWLSPYRLFAPPGVSIKGVHTRMGDFVRGELAHAVDKPAITGDALKHYLKLAAGKRAVAFCVSVEHSKHVTAQFNAAGIRAEHVDGETDVEERDQATKSFAKGTSLLLSNVELFGEGFDLPAIEVAILLRPTQSLGLYLQQVGRALRPVYATGFDLSTASGRKAAIAAGPKPYAIILDHAGNCERHGLPDQVREWSLEGRSSKTGGSSGAFVRTCPKCSAAQFPGPVACKICGHVFGVNPREVEYREGDLVELETAAANFLKGREVKDAQTLEVLINYGIKKRYRFPEKWAEHVLGARQKKAADAYLAKLKGGAA